jgi:lipid A 3-O-deacylase
MFVTDAPSVTPTTWDMKAQTFFIFLLILFSITESYALEGISVGIGKSKDSIEIYRLGLQRQFGSKWFESKLGYFSGYHEVSLNYWEHKGESIKGIAYSPVFIYGFAGLSNDIFPYLEAGIGVSYLSEKKIKGRDLSSHFQFEDRIGIGAKIGEQKRHDLSFRYMHYSNASIKQPNDGIDIFIFSYAYSF